MKKILLATAGPVLQDVLRRLLFKTNRRAVAPKPSPIISSFLELGRRKTVNHSQNLWRRRMLLKQKPSKHSANGLLGFITLSIYTPLEARYYCAHNNYCMEVAHRYGQLYLHCSLIYFWVPSVVFA